jgi:hypothetical protein
MSRCTKCNGSFIQKPLTLEEAIEASKGFQVIPSCLFNRNLEFWKCTDCNQLYWEVLTHILSYIILFMFYYIISPPMHPLLCICREPNTTMQFRSFCQSAILVTEQCKLGMCCKRRRFHHLPRLEESAKLLSVWDFEQPVMRQAFVGLMCITSRCK